MYVYIYIIIHFSIDASEEDGSFGRLINDDHKTPNLKVKTVQVNGLPHLCLFSIRDVVAGEELTYCYGDAEWPWRTQVRRFFILDAK